MMCSIVCGVSSPSLRIGSRNSTSCILAQSSVQRAGGARMEHSGNAASVGKQLHNHATLWQARHMFACEQTKNFWFARA